MLCRAHLGEVQQRYDELRELGAEVLVVTQAPAALLKLVLREQALPFPLVGDPSRNAYRLLGMGRTSWWSLLRPSVVLRFFRLLFGGWRPRRPVAGEDVLQLGGDFVFDRQGRLTYAHPSAGPTDRPSVEELLRAVRDAVERS
jgi:peroxiredoxin